MKFAYPGQNGMRHTPLPTNYKVAKKRPTTILRKLRADDLLEQHDKVFKEWDQKLVYNLQYAYIGRFFLLKGHGTTQVRPLFDA